jgi:hypothetical protein
VPSAVEQDNRKLLHNFLDSRVSRKCEAPPLTLQLGSSPPLFKIIDIRDLEPYTGLVRSLGIKAKASVCILHVLT